MPAAAYTPTGVLAGAGSAMVHALVYTGAVPHEPPAELADVAAAVVDDDGAVRDWKVDLTTLLRDHDAHVHDLSRAFTEWRSSFVTESVIGDVATVRAFMLWADPLAD